MRSVSYRWIGIGAVGLASILGLLATGCASAKQVQHFEVVYEDPDTGEQTKNYYRMTIRGGTSNPFMPVVYKLKAAYLNVATVDVLEGKGPFVPEADLPRAADEKYKKTMGHYRDLIEERAAAAKAGGNHPDDAIIETARMAWFASLSDGDVVSMGQTQSANPYEFRKLVFYATSQNLDLQKTIGPQIDSMISKVQTLARKEQERAQRNKKQRKGMHLLADTVFQTNPQMKALFKTFFPLDDDDQAENPSGSSPSGLTGTAGSPAAQPGAQPTPAAPAPGTTANPPPQPPAASPATTPATTPSPPPSSPPATPPAPGANGP